MLRYSDVPDLMRGKMAWQKLVMVIPPCELGHGK